MPRLRGKSMLAVTYALRLFLLFAFPLFASVSFSYADSPTTEYKVKAAMIFKILKFVRWPDEAVQTGSTGERELNICILGNDPFGDAIDAVDGRSVGDYKIAITRLESIEEIEGRCHVLFVSPSMEGLTAILEATRGRPLLTIADDEEFAESGGLIEFVKVRQKIGFEINKTQADVARMHISSQLLAIAEEVF